MEKPQNVTKSENINGKDNFIKIKIENITKTYPGGTVGVDNLSLNIKEGEIFGFLGQNGAGKTTCIRCILNILIPDNGTIFVNNVQVNRDHPEIKENIGYLPGELNIPTYYKVKDFLNYIASLRNSQATRLEEISELFDLPLDKSVNELSKGNKQKIGIVIAFMNDPEILILDEPSSGLDPIYQQTLYDLILQEKKRGKTIFFSSHNLDEVQRICDRVGIIRMGKLVSVESVKDLSEKIARQVKVIFENLDENSISNVESNFNVKSSNLYLNEINIEVKSFEDFGKILGKLESIGGIRDVVYPPASLESFFLSQYKEN